MFFPDETVEIPSHFITITIPNGNVLTFSNGCVFLRAPTAKNYKFIDNSEGVVYFSSTN